MRCLLIYPPQWIPNNPYFSVPILAGQLRNAGFDCDVIDFNIKFYEKILNKEFLTSAFQSAKESLININSLIYSKSINLSAFDLLSMDEKILLKKQEVLNTYFNTRLKQSQNAIRYIDSAKDILRSNEFYNFQSYYKAHRIIEYALELASLPYAPSKISLLDYSNPLLNANFQDIKYQLDKSDINPFIDFFSDELQKISLNYDLILISITGKSQIVPSFTLVKLLRDTFGFNAHISVGGNLIAKDYENFIKYPEIFDNFIDSVMVGEGESTVVKLAETLNKRNDISDVPSLIYKKNDIIKMNDVKEFDDINCISLPSLVGFDLKSYYSPEIIALIQATKGCHWGRCAFCDLSFGKKYSIKSVNRLVDEIEYYINVSGIKKFWFIDETIKPEYYIEFAREILKRKLNINYYGLARLENNFTEENCKLLYKSGLRTLMWGYECASERVFKMMNKGINPSNRLQILKNSANAKIWNHLFLIFGFPSENEIEANETISEIVNNKNIVGTYLAHIFSLQRHSFIKENCDKYGITSFFEKEEFEECLDIDYQNSNLLLSRSVLENKIDTLSKLFWENDQKSAIRYLLSTDFLLYLSNYGYDDIKNITADFINFDKRISN